MSAVILSGFALDFQGGDRYVAHIWSTLCFEEAIIELTVGDLRHRSALACHVDGHGITRRRATAVNHRLRPQSVP